MDIIEHRINTIEQLMTIPKSHGVEVDVRYHHNDLILHHDPFGHHQTQPVLLKEFVSHYDLQGPLILNIKTEGIERHCIDLMIQYQIKHWFFLDLSMPYFVKYARYIQNNKIEGFTKENLATRFSEYETLAYCLEFKNLAGWLWIDYFNAYPLTMLHYEQIKDVFKCCLVSPELQGHSVEKINDLKQQIISQNIDAVCTKRPELWRK